MFATTNVHVLHQRQASSDDVMNTARMPHAPLFVHACCNYVIKVANMPYLFPMKHKS